MADVEVAEQRRRLIAWLERRGTPATVVHETHVSILAFTSDRVWKCKKAVRFPFIDLSSAELRRANCEREVLLNRRLAPDVYLGVVALEDHGGAAVDYLVEMRRLPESCRLAALVSHGEGAACVDAAIDLLVPFHERAATGGEIDRAATVPALTDLWQRSLDELAPFTGRVLDPDTYARVADDSLGYLRGRGPLFADRIANTRIRDGHGDLLADDVFCLPEGPRVLDCLEFDDRLRFGDVLADVGFLAMDLERLNRHDLARRLLDGYRNAAGEDWPPSLADFYLAYRAVVRAKVACLRLTDDPDAAVSAQHLLAQAAAHLARARPRVVLIGGPPATGKTTVARALARDTGWLVLRSDEIRKEIAGVPAGRSVGAPIDRGLYSDAWNEQTYAELIDRARRQLEWGYSVILDASWSTDLQRDKARSLAAATASVLSSFRCEVPAAVADTRAAARAREAVDASDASPAIAAALRSRFAAWPGAEQLDATRPPEEIASVIRARIERSG